MNLTPENPVAAQARNADIIRSQVREDYARVAQASGLSDCCCSAHTCCGDAPEVSINTLVSLRLGYSQADLDLMPAGADMGLGCGNPTAIAALRHGEVVADLGAGGGIDAFLAARAVGTSGRVIGIDMTPDMVSKARHHAERGGFANVEFRLGEIEYLPLADASVDVILSNCVINLSPDKAAVFREAYRVLRPGGRLAVSDMMTRGHFTPDDRANLSAWADCITGAEDVALYAAAMRAAGFADISIVDKTEPAVELAALPAESGPAQLFSARVTAVKR